MKLLLLPPNKVGVAGEGGPQASGHPTTLMEGKARRQAQIQGLGDVYRRDSRDQCRRYEDSHQLRDYIQL